MTGETRASGGARAVVVVGASGGSGASLLAGALALAWQRERPGAWLLELDVGRGDLAGAWDLPGDRTLTDLVAVADELGPAHARAAAQAHPSGVTALVAPDKPGGGAWSAAAASRLVAATVAAAGVGGRCAVDAGCGLGAAALGAIERADGVLLVCAPRLSAARRARSILTALAPTGDDARCALVVGRGPGRGELGTRALGRAVGAPVLAELPWAEREAAELSAGRWPRGRRRGLAAAAAALAGVVG